MAKKNQEVALLNADTLTKDNVPQLLEIVAGKIKDLKKNMGEKPKDLGNFPQFGRLSDVNSLSQLIKMQAAINSMQTEYAKAAKEIVPKGVNHAAYTINGHSPATWTEAIKFRANEVSFKKQLTQLENTKSTLESHLSEDLKLQNDLKRIATTLSEDIVE